MCPSRKYQPCGNLFLLSIQLPQLWYARLIETLEPLVLIVEYFLYIHCIYQIQAFCVVVFHLSFWQWCHHILYPMLRCGRASWITATALVFVISKPLGSEVKRQNHKNKSSCSNSSCSTSRWTVWMRTFTDMLRCGMWCANHHPLELFLLMERLQSPGRQISKCCF